MPPRACETGESTAEARAISENRAILLEWVVLAVLWIATAAIGLYVAFAPRLDEQPRVRHPQSAPLAPRPLLEGLPVFSAKASW